MTDMTDMTDMIDRQTHTHRHTQSLEQVYRSQAPPSTLIISYLQMIQYEHLWAMAIEWENIRDAPWRTVTIRDTFNSSAAQGLLQLLPRLAGGAMGAGHSLPELCMDLEFWTVCSLDCQVLSNMECFRDNSSSLECFRDNSSSLQLST